MKCIKTISNFDRRIIRTLIKTAIKNKQNKKFTHAAALVNKKRILFISVNSYEKTSPLTPQLIPNQLITKHAEIGCLNWLSNNIQFYPNTQFDLYITGLSKAHSSSLIQNSKPCSNCLSVIKQFPIKQVIYSQFNSINKWSLYEERTA